MLIQQFDTAFLCLSLLMACMRAAKGGAREFMHLVIFCLAAFLAYVLFAAQIERMDIQDAPRLLSNLGYFSIGIYLLSWLSIKHLVPIIFGEQGITKTGRVLGFIIGSAKLSVILFALNFVYALHSPYTQRLDYLPAMLSQAQSVQISDKIVQNLYAKLAEHNLVVYQKYIYNTEKSEFEQGLNEMQRLFNQVF